MPNKSSEVSPISVWGKVITELRSLNTGILFVACGEVSNVKIENKTFVIYAQENNKNIMQMPNNFKLLQEVISKYLPNYDITVKTDEEWLLTEEKLRKLKQLFGDKLIIKEDFYGDEF